MRLASATVEQRVAALAPALKYGEVGLDLVIQVLKDESKQVQKATVNLLFQKRTEPRVKQALRGYNLWLLLVCLRTI